MNELQKYITDRCYRIPGVKTKFITFRGAFMASLLPRQQQRVAPSQAPDRNQHPIPNRA